MENLKVVKLTASNVKRLHAVEITPEGSTVIVGGKNGQGKSSVLDSISYALGGQKLIPSEPIRKGQKTADIKIDLGDIIVTRRFRRDPLECDCVLKKDEPTVVTHAKTCASHKFGETRSSLVVTTREGLEYPSPQAVLNKLLGQLTFDPLAFVNAESKEQVEILRRVVNLDTSELDEERAQVYMERTVLNRQLNTESVKEQQMPFFAEDGLDLQLTVGIKTELENAQVARAAYDAKQESVERIQRQFDALEVTTERRRSEIARMEQELSALKKVQAEEEESLRKHSHDLKVTIKDREKLYKAIPNITEITSRMTAMEAKNARIQQNIDKKAQLDRVKKLSLQVGAKTDTIEEIDDAKRKLIESVKYPVDGLGFDFERNRVMFNGIPFDQASKAEQIRVSVAIGLAVNPKLRVLLVKDGSALDSEGMRLIAKLAEDANAQFWIERVAESKDGAMVMIEDGEVV